MNTSKLPVTEFENLANQLKNTPSEELSRAFVEREGISETEKEILQKDYQDSYAIRQRRKQISVQILDYLPRMAFFLLWAVVLLTVFILSCYVYHISGDEKKLFEILWNFIYTTLVSFASIYMKGVFTERK